MEAPEHAGKPRRGDEEEDAARGGGPPSRADDSHATFSPQQFEAIQKMLNQALAAANSSKPKENDRAASTGPSKSMSAALIEEEQVDTSASAVRPLTAAGIAEQFRSYPPAPEHMWGQCQRDPSLQGTPTVWLSQVHGDSFRDLQSSLHSPTLKFLLRSLFTVHSYLGSSLFRQKELADIAAAAESKDDLLQLAEEVHEVFADSQESIGGCLTLISRVFGLLQSVADGQLSFEDAADLFTLGESEDGRFDTAFATLRAVSQAQRAVATMRRQATPRNTSATAATGGARRGGPPRFNQRGGFSGRNGRSRTAASSDATAAPQGSQRAAGRGGGRGAGGDNP